MNHIDRQDTPITHTDLIRHLNDQLRTKGLGGKIFQTQGICALDEATHDAVLQAIQSFNDFNEDNDPYSEHDCASLKVLGREVMFKIDYYDRTLTYHSTNPADARITTRILTIMLVEEY